VTRHGRTNGEAAQIATRKIARNAYDFAQANIYGSDDHNCEVEGPAMTTPKSARMKPDASSFEWSGDRTMEYAVQTSKVHRKCVRDLPRHQFVTGASGKTFKLKFAITVEHRKESSHQSIEITRKIMFLR